MHWSVVAVHGKSENQNMNYTVDLQLNKIIRINYQQIKSPLKLNQNWLLIHCDYGSFCSEHLMGTACNSMGNNRHLNWNPKQTARWASLFNMNEVHTKSGNRNSAGKISVASYLIQLICVYKGMQIINVSIINVYCYSLYVVYCIAVVALCVVLVLWGWSKC